MRNINKINECAGTPIYITTLSRGYFGSWGRTLVAVAVVERWPL